MAVATTDVREWLRSQGDKVGDRGAIPGDLMKKYEAAHSTVPGEVVESDYPDVAAGTDVTEAADVPSAGPGPGPGPAETPARGSSGERRPRAVKPARRKRGGGWFRKVFGGTGGGKKRRSGPRESLGDFAEETWLDLAWLAEPIPPLSKILTIQAPYAGVVFDEHVQGTVVDAVLQPLARYSGVWRALNGLMGPPVCVLAICAQGRYLEEGGQIIIDPRTRRPVPDARTRMMFGMLRYSLLQMAKVSDVSAEEIGERTESMTGRMRVVDKIIADLFGFTEASPSAAGTPSAADTPGSAPPPTGSGPREPREGNYYAYPDAPSMDGAGADPGRL